MDTFSVFGTLIALLKQQNYFRIDDIDIFDGKVVILAIFWINKRILYEFVKECFMVSTKELKCYFYQLNSNFEIRQKINSYFSKLANQKN